MFNHWYKPYLILNLVNCLNSHIEIFKVVPSIFLNGVYSRHTSVGFLITSYYVMWKFKVSHLRSSVSLSKPFGNIKVLQMHIRGSSIGRWRGDRETISVVIELDYIVSMRSFRRLEVWFILMFFKCREGKKIVNVVLTFYKLERLSLLVKYPCCRSGLFQYITCCHVC